MRTEHVDSSIWFIVLGCLLIAAILILTATKPGPARSPLHQPRPTVITEDDPRWDCRTMGNRVCGQP